MPFICSVCNAEHSLDEISFGTAAPAQWDLLNETERSRSLLGGEQCEIDCAEGKSYYIRACLEIPIVGKNRSFTWGVWCSLSEGNYAEVAEHWEDPARENLGPYFAWLCTSIPHYPDTMYLKTMVHQRAVGRRPLVELEPTDHPLSVDQRLGITEERLKDIVVKVLHRES